MYIDKDIFEIIMNNQFDLKIERFELEKLK